MESRDLDINIIGYCSDLTWRKPFLSDWCIKLADLQYSVHKCIIALGKRASLFFFAAFNNDYSSQSLTDLSTLLPQSCHAVFEDVLDFMYGSEVSIAPATVVYMRAIAHILQMKTLYDTCETYLEQAIDKSDVCAVLLSSALRLDTAGREKSLVNETFNKVVSHFNDVPSEQLSSLPIDVMVQVVDSDALKAHESIVFRAMKKYAAQTSLTEVQKETLWNAVRLAHLSPRELADAILSKEIPSTSWVTECLALASVRQDKEADFKKIIATFHEDSPKRRRLEPRRAFCSCIHWKIFPGFPSSAQVISIVNPIHVEKRDSRCGGRFYGMAVVSDCLLLSQRVSSFAIRFLSRPFGCRFACGVAQSAELARGQQSGSLGPFFVEDNAFSWAVHLPSGRLRHKGADLGSTDSQFGEGDVLQISYHGPAGKLFFFKNASRMGVIDGATGDLVPAVQFCCSASAFVSVPPEIAVPDVG